MPCYGAFFLLALLLFPLLLPTIVVHFLLARGSEDIFSCLICLPPWNGSICAIGLDSVPSSPLHFSIAVFYPSALPAFESKAGTAYTHLSLALKKKNYTFFLPLENMFKYLAPIFTAV